MQAAGKDWLKFFFSKMRRFFKLNSLENKMNSGVKVLRNKFDKNQRFLNCNFFPKNSKGQITIFVITAVVIVAIVGLFFLADSRMAITGKAVEANMFFGVGSSGLGILFIFASIMLFLIAWALREN